MPEKGNYEFLKNLNRQFFQTNSKTSQMFHLQMLITFSFLRHLQIFFVFAIFVRDVVPSMFHRILEKSVGLLKNTGHTTHESRVSAHDIPLPFGSADNESRRSLHLTVVCSLLFPMRVLLLVFAVIYAGERPNSGFE